MLKSTFCFLAVAITFAARTAFGAEDRKLPLIYSDNFEKGADHWQPTDAGAWKIADALGGGRVYSHFTPSNYTPPHRSPLNISLLKDVVVSDFVLEAKALSTGKETPRRDLCIIFGYQSPTRFYYAHVAKSSDNNHNQIFIVNDAPRAKITTQTNAGNNWDDKWHNLKVVRRVADGAIEVYFDDMHKPVMTATDKTFTWGQVGIGTFDDLGNWDDFKLYGTKVDRGS